MLSSSTRNRVVIPLSAIAQLSLTREALAHAAHHEPAQAEDSQPQGNEKAQADDLSSPAATPAANSATNSQILKQKTAPIASEEAVSVQEPVAAAKAELLQGISIGLGESLLALIIVGPFILRFWKKKSQS